MKPRLLSQVGYYIVLYRKYSSSTNLPIILPLCDIANLFECVAMFYFVKMLSAFRIVTKPCANGLLLLGRFAIFLHHALDVGSFGRGKERLVLFRTKMDNRMDCPFENIDCVIFYHSHTMSPSKRIESCF